MVGSALGIVFDDEDRRVLPEWTAGNRFDDPPEREIVVGNHRSRGERAGRRSARVIVAEMQDRELRQVVVLYEAVELLQPGVDPLLIGDLEIKPGKRRRNQVLQPRYCFDGDDVP